MSETVQVTEYKYDDKGQCVYIATTTSEVEENKKDKGYEVGDMIQCTCPHCTMSYATKLT